MLGAVELLGEVDGYPLSGLSGLAWDPAAQLLYAVSDLGHLVHLRLRFGANGGLTAAQPLAVYPLRGPEGRPLPPGSRDAEALALEGAPGAGAALLLAFEGAPRLIRYDVQGRWLGELALPPPVADPRRFQNANRGLEAVVLDPERGLLVAPEAPLRHGPVGLVPLLAVAGGAIWWYPLLAAPVRR